MINLFYSHYRIENYTFKFWIVNHTWPKWLFLKTGPGPWTLDPDPDPRPWTLHSGSGPFTQTLKNLDPEKPAIYVGLKIYLFIYLFILSLILTITEKILFTIKIAVKC